MQVRIARSAETDLLEGFAIYYDVRDDIATVVAVLDCRQNPASITKRLKHR